MADLPTDADDVRITDATVETRKANVKFHDINRLAVDIALTRPGAFFARAAVDSGASSDLNVDGSSTPVEFDIVANSGKKFFIHRIILVLQDQNINFTKFGGIAGGITNGLEMESQEGGEAIRDIGAFSSIKVNAQFAFAGAGISITASATDLMIIDFNLSARGTTFELVDSNSDFLRFTVNDNLSSIDSFKVVAQGYEVDE